MQTVPATASLGPAYATTPTVGYRILALDGSVATAYTTANVVSLGGGFYRVTGGVSAPEAGGIIQWWSNNPNNGGVLLAVAAVEPDHAAAITKGAFEIDYPNSTAIQRNPDGTVAQTFTLLDAGDNPATSAQTAVKRVPQ